MKALDNILEKGVPYLAAQGYGNGQDIENCEEAGAMAGANTRAVSQRAKKRGLDQVGTLGSGNHFLEVQKVEKVFDEEKARAFGLHQGQAVVMIHTG